jgi:restriction endonuclease S subunit/methylase of polypeptide subunit release factors
MWQSVRLTSQTQNQFLGDMFEFFLDNGIKQTQGQFFTPIPICKFIVASLPLEQKISEKSEPLNVIDYACGSGHFLTEYALAAQPIIEKYKETSVKQHFQHIYGIEKEDRLAKVATVSACMYGQNEINVIDTDALASHEVLRKENFDVLVANPPFAVDDFLDTLVKNDEKEAKTYELFAEDRIGTNNIQCLFLERAKQLLARNGVAGIIVPTSILSNSDTMHIQTREILLKYFDWISIVELGSGTFGKTGTNTVVLFLRRKEQNPEQAEHFWNRTLDFFENADEEIESNGGMYQDLPIVKKYCQHINIPFEIYQKILHTTPQGLEALVELEKYDIFKEYKNSFEKSTEVVNLQKKNDFKKLLPEKQTEKLNKMLWEFIRKTEQEKLFYFMLAHQNTQKVLIVKSPADSKEQKQFLGYEWTNAMGNEGIKYNNGETVYDINTPLFNPNDRNDQTKISYWIAQNFKSLPASPQGLEALAGIVSYANLTDLLDFSRKDFNKAISLTMKKKVEVESKWEMVKIEELCEIGRGRVINHQYIDENQGEYPVYSSQTQNEGVMGSINTFDFDGEYVTWTTDGIYAGTCFYRNGKFNCTNVCGTLKAKNEKLIIQFLPLVLNDITPNHVVKSANPKLMNNVMANIKIPLPPLEIQEKIVLECEAIDKAAESAKNEVEKAKKEIEEKAKSWFETSFEMLKIENVLILEYGKGLPEEKRILGEFAVMGSNGITGYHNEYLVTAPAIIVGRKGSAGKLVYTEKNCYPIDTTFYVKPILDCNMKYLYYTLLQLKLDEMGKGTGVPGLNRNDVYQIKIPVPPLSTQETLVSEIEKLELQIAENQGLINGAKAKKEEVLKRYL